MENTTQTNTEVHHHQFLTSDSDLQLRMQDAMCVNESELKHPWWHNLKYLLAGTIFGIVLVKSEAISWFRMQEMFRFQSFHMFGIIGSAIVVGAIGLWLLRKFKVKTIYGEPIEVTKKTFNKGNIYGGLIFGLGWGITGACPGPLYVLVGTGASVIIVALISALAGTWVYGKYRDKLPH